MEYTKTTTPTEAQCYGYVWHPVDKTVNICYRQGADVTKQPEDMTAEQVSACKAFASAFGVDEFEVTKEVIEKDIDDKIAEIVASKVIVEPIETPVK